MNVDHEDLVAFALGELDEEQAAAVRTAVAGDRALGTELEAVRAHLALHERAPEIRPTPHLWRGIEARLDTSPRPRSLLARFWMPLAAAALLVAALIFPGGGPEVVALHGAVARSPSGAWTARDVARLRVGKGVTATLDAGTVLVPLSNERLALEAGRALFEVEPARRGFAVRAGDLVVTTTGTAFLVGVRDGRGYALVEQGRVRCERDGTAAEIGAGQTFGTSPLPLSAVRSWFQRPAIEAKILDDSSVRVVIRNEMPDAIQLAPPTGGEPFFFLTYAGHQYPVTPPDLDTPLRLMPGEERSLDLDLPVPLPDGQPLFVSYPHRGVEVEARR